MNRKRKWFEGVMLLIALCVASLWSGSPGEIYAQEEIAGETKVASEGLVDLDLEDTDIRDAVKALARIGGVNIVVGKEVQATVTMRLEKVYWETALDIILKTYGLTSVREGNCIRIMSYEVLKNEENNVPLVTEILYLNFVDAGDIKASMSSMLTKRGSIEVDERTNALIVTDIPIVVAEVVRVAKELDTRTPQVLIEAMLVDVKLTKDDELGISWKIMSSDSPGSSNYIQQPSAMSSTSSTAITFALGKKLGGYDLVGGLVNAWVQDAKANVLASPKIVTLDNKTAKIEIKSQVSYTETTTTDQGTVATTQFKDVVTSLEVTPHITKEGSISMNIKPRQEFVEATVSGQPQIGSRTAETNVLVEDGETIVIGGLRKVEDNATYTKAPFLGDIPLLGALFRKKDVQKVNTELVMFVTPHIIVHPQLTDEDKERYRLLEEVRENFVKEQEKEKKKKSKGKEDQTSLIESGITEETALETRGEGKAELGVKEKAEREAEREKRLIAEREKAVLQAQAELEAKRETEEKERLLAEREQAKLQAQAELRAERETEREKRLIAEREKAVLQARAELEARRETEEKARLIAEKETRLLVQAELYAKREAEKRARQTTAENEETKLQAQMELEKKIDYHYQYGKEYFESGRYQEAIGEFEAVLNLNPEHRYSATYLQLSEKRLGEAQKIEESKLPAYREEIKTEAAETKEKAVYSGAISPYRKSEGEISVGAKADYEELKACYREGERYFQEGNYSEAIARFKKVAELNGSF